MGALAALAAGSGILGLLFLAGGARRLSKSQFVSGGGSTLWGALMVAVAAVAGLFGVNLNTYDRLTYEQPVATVTFTATGAPRTYDAAVREPDGAERSFQLVGDAWQIDARVLKFDSWANVAGLDAVYRLDRISGRYDDVDEERSEARSVHALSENPGLDIWRIANERSGTVRGVDASYGSGAYVPMADGASYEVALTQSGLVARAVNPVAQQAVADWR